MFLLGCIGLLLAWQARAASPSGHDVALAQSSGLKLDEALLGIFAYTRWPTSPDPLRLCVLGSSPAAARLLQHGLPRPAERPNIQVRGVVPDASVVQACDVLYVGQLDEGAWRQLLPHLLAQPVLTICERSPVCVSGGMFCLDVDAAGHVQFEVNLDSVARSKIRVHPQVLRLGRRQNGVPQ